MNPALLQFIAEFTLRIINEFQNRGVVLTEQQIKDRFEVDFNTAIANNQILLDETK